jgi:hypothetical protein
VSGEKMLTTLHTDMEKDMKTTISAAKTSTVTNTNSRVDEQIMKVGATVIGLTSGVIGLWAVACLIGGMVASGGPIALVTDLFRAVAG